ncbi:hypothetical protein MNB_SV-5-133 [hydrothermal vent metagenome]|uniref:Uncharacterized protein n=1 Tax=hydrothermal vent metagenome TaxID=652676 RepID=A0A1W1ECL1_9ZZZZ
MNVVYGARDIVRNPSLLRIDSNESFIVEDKKAHKRLGIYLGVDLAEEFFSYKKKDKLLNAAKKIKENAIKENLLLDESVDDGL